MRRNRAKTTPKDTLANRETDWERFTGTFGDHQVVGHPPFPKRKPKRWSDAKTLKISNYNHFQNLPSRKGHPNPSNTLSQTPQNHPSSAQNPAILDPLFLDFVTFLETCSNMFPGHFRTILGQKRHHIRHLKTGFWYPKTLISTLPNKGAPQPGSLKETIMARF